MEVWPLLSHSKGHNQNLIIRGVPESSPKDNKRIYSYSNTLKGGQKNNV
jgi:hypothetical protein